MNLDATAVDERSARRVSLSGQRTEDAFLDAALGPADKPIIGRLFGSIDVGTVRLPRYWVRTLEGVKPFDGFVGTVFFG